MRKIFTIISIASSFFAIGQPKLPNALSGKVAGLTVCSIPDPNARIVFRCQRTVTSNDILLIIDGIPYEANWINKINPDTIESVTVLKPGESGALWGCRAANGALIITTKSNKFRKFIIKDFLEGTTIPAATMKFKSKTNKNDSLVVAANDSGVVLTNKLKPGDNYDVEVSSVGFKTYLSYFKNSLAYNEQTIFLEKNINTLSEVVIQSPGWIRCGCCRCCCAGIRVTYDYPDLKDSLNHKSLFKIYPNPVKRGSNFNLDLLTEISSGRTIRIISLSGATISQEKISNNKWKTISLASYSSWAAGTYIVQLIDEKGKQLGQQKLIIQ